MVDNMYVPHIQQCLENAVLNRGFSWADYSGFSLGPLEENLGDGYRAFSSSEVLIGSGADPEEVWDKYYFLEYMSRMGHKALEALIWFDMLKNDKVDQEWIDSIKRSLKVIDKKLEKYYLDESYVPRITEVYIQSWDK